MSRRPARPSLFLPRLAAGLTVTVLGLGLVSLVVEGSASAPLLALLQTISLFGVGTVIIAGAVIYVIVRLGGWREPEAQFDALIEHSERLARGGSSEDDDFTASWPDEEDGLEVAAVDVGFDALLRSVIDELPLDFHRALEHVAIVVSDSGATAVRTRHGHRGAYGMYQGDTVANDYFTERILIFRDTLLRDFGHDPERLRQQVRRVLRHELAHHLGWDERGVRKLGL
ncbi:metallopeptidase family protein [Conexibacter sp. DBS9H8]|uniref:metallopeptidase family protein n=1 Tax=Conexibacter sp. DBS9H8 TaxID=2937801 RepID=UPI00200E0D46|nr:metallopeptidase family protein [Conexibacter sp. DBS9H8]